ncbi:serine/threonine-protein kinase [Leptolyngbya sp. PCC 6406]|uniref:serine/threonine-protein kinase n=1 Tax=Leptolyngbya sp. PCC 6406 TaxID=1173264 RepID=UPI0002AC60EA|nr:serine/threonine-protein kinase [Leptolyngbya sp. PCC 6406]
MSHCVNPDCSRPQNPESHRFCHGCGSRLRLGERYEAVQVLGVHTWLGRDRNTLVKPQCLIQRFPRQEPQQDRAIAADRLRRDIARLDEASQHPQLPQLLGYFEQGGHQYLVQDYVVGEKLDQRLQAWGTFEPEAIRRLLVDLLPVLHHLHHHGIIHRDIKPQNLLQPPGDPHWWLVGLGSAKALTKTRLAQPGTLIGSAEYAAPEQLRGEATYASDLYSLGVSCLHVLTGLRPFELFDGVNGCWYWRSLVPEMPPALATLIDRMVQPNLCDRVSSTEDLMAMLGLPLPETVLQAPLPPLRPLPWQPQSQHQGIGPLLAATVLARPALVLLLTPTGDLHLQSPTNLTTPPLPWPDSPPQASAIAAHPQLPVLALGTRRGELWLARGEGAEITPPWRWQGPFLGHRGGITQICFTAARSTPARSTAAASSATPTAALDLITAGEDGTLRRWDGQTGALRATWHDHGPHPVQALALGGDGQTLASGDRAGRVKLWSLNTGLCLRTLTGHTGAISALAWSSENTVISAGWDVCLWWRRAATGGSQQRVTAAGFMLPVRSLLSLPDQRVVSGSQDGHLQLWSGNTSGNTSTAIAQAQPSASPILALLPLPGAAGTPAQWVSVSQSGTLAQWVAPDSAEGSAG